MFTAWTEEPELSNLSKTHACAPHFLFQILASSKAHNPVMINPALRTILALRAFSHAASGNCVAFLEVNRSYGSQGHYIRGGSRFSASVVAAILSQDRLVATSHSRPAAFRDIGFME